MKKLLLLGGLRYLIPIIKKAHELGIYVITCDYIEDNIAHKYSDEYHNVSIIDKEAVLDLAKKLKIDGIMSFAVDPGVITAAYVAEKLGLPSPGPYRSVEILQNKDKFRQFLRENGFNCPLSEGFSSLPDAIKVIDRFQFPIMVKPTDSAGSKGVKKVEKLSELPSAFEHAIQFSASKKVIIEEFIEAVGFPTSSECFSIDGELKFMTFSDQHFDLSAPNAYTPMGNSWPGSIPQEHQQYLFDELNRLIHLLDLKTSIYNVESRLGKDGKAYLMEVSPRGGGNRLAEILCKATQINLIEASIKSALGMKIEKMEMPIYNGFWTSSILYSKESGIFDHLHIPQNLKPYIQEEDLWLKEGDKLASFTGANAAIGILVFRFPTEKEFKDHFAQIIANSIVVLRQ